jgi:phosphoribosylaminoimidazolecarboxamide formyltransferase/IMP cyclohydrolase
MEAPKIKTALISVYDKTGIVQFAKELTRFGIELLSTGGTSKLLIENSIPVQEIADYTGFPEILNGRVKSLHPKIHAGLLYRRNNKSDQQTVHKLGIKPIDLVVVNLYPFEEVTSRPIDLAAAVENIDIGGPSMIRSAAKNYQSVAVVIDPADYSRILSELLSSACHLSERTRLELMLKAFQRTAAYDVAISSYFLHEAIRQGAVTEWRAPERLLMSFEKVRDLRYGENPHQKAAVYKDPRAPSCIALAKQVAGEKELSYTNLLDADAAYRLIKEFRNEYATVIVKHTNPCGVGRGRTLKESCNRALSTDPASAFGGIYAFSKTLDPETAKVLEGKFIELVLAPGYDPEALKILSAKKNRRILNISDIIASGTSEIAEKNFRRILGGILIQDSDEAPVEEEKMTVATKRKPTEDEEEALRFAWKIVRRVKSNAIVLCSKEQLVGVGAGQMSRVDSCRIALMKAQEAGLGVRGTVMASDAFFPFRDSVDLMGKAGVTAIVHPGGSIRDKEVVDAAEEFGIAMVFTGIRHFAH